MSGSLQVILSVRDPDKWYDSYVASLLWLYRTWWFKPFSWCFPMGWKLQVSAPPLSGFVSGFKSMLAQGAH